MKNAKSFGRGQVTSRDNQGSRRTGIGWVKEIMNETWKTSTVTQDWGKANVYPIYKECEKTAIIIVVYQCCYTQAKYT